jgi:hypothetical protein
MKKETTKTMASLLLLLPLRLLSLKKSQHDTFSLTLISFVTFITYRKTNTIMKTLTEKIAVARITKQKVAQFFLYSTCKKIDYSFLKLIPFTFTSICFCNNIFITYPNQSGFRRCCYYSFSLILKSTVASVVTYKARRLGMAVTNVLFYISPSNL